MMDKLDIRLNTLMPLRPEFDDFLNEIRDKPKEYGFHQSEHYAVVGSLNPIGIDGNFHGWLRHRRNDEMQTHKVELNDVGLTGKTRVLADLERIVDLDPRRLEIMRIDLAADIPDVPVSYFHRHMRIALKRRGAKVTQFEHIYQGEGETIYFGKRPNCYRVYNKIAELKVQHKRQIRNAKKEYDPVAQRMIFRELQPVVCYCDPEEGNCDCQLEKAMAQKWPTFEETFERKESDVLTRIERQITGRHIPTSVPTLGKLDTLPDFNPYLAIEMFGTETALPMMHSKFNFPQYHAGLWLRQMQKEHGIDYVRTYIRNFVGKQNATATFEQYEPFFSAEDHSAKVTPGEIFESYRNSVRRQLAA